MGWYIPVSSWVPKMGITSGLLQAFLEPQLALKSDNNINLFSESKDGIVNFGKRRTGDGRVCGQVKKRNK